MPWLACALALLAWWLWLAPAQVGGPATYVRVSGTSMEPMLHTGDVVIARGERPYAVGDLVVIQLSTGLVIHRLVDGDAKSGWTTRGDHNTWDDPWVLRDDQVLGRAWATVPRGGEDAPECGRFGGVRCHCPRVYRRLRGWRGGSERVGRVRVR